MRSINRKNGTSLFFAVQLLWITFNFAAFASSPPVFWPLSATYGLQDIGSSNLNLDGEWQSKSVRPVYYTQGPDNSPNGAVVLGPGADDYVSFNYTQLQFDGTQSFTFALFFKSLGNEGPIIEYGNDNAPLGWHLWANFPLKDRLFLVTNNDHACQHSIGWQFIAVRYQSSGNTFSLFCQDQWISISNVPSFPNATFASAMTLGKRSGLNVPAGHASCMSLHMTSLNMQEICDIKWTLCLRKSRWLANDACRLSLLGYWPLNSWSKIKDQSGNNLHGVYASSSNPAYVIGPDGDPSTGLQIGPTSNDFPYFNYSALDVMANNASDMSIVLYFNSNLIKASNAILEYFFRKIVNNKTSYFGYHIWANYPIKNNVYANPVYVSGRTSNRTCNFDAGWQFVAVVYNRTAQTISIFCDDKWQIPSTTNETGLETSSGYFTLGKRYGGSVLQTQFSCLSIYTEALSQTQLCDIKWRTCLGQTRLSAMEGCAVTQIGWWPLSRAYGVADIAGFGFDGLYASNSRTPNFTMGPDGRTDGAVILGPKEDDYITISNSQWYAFNSNASWTITIYFKVLDPKGGPVVEYANLGFSIWANFTDKLWVATGDKGMGQAFDCSFKCWQFIAVSYDATSKGMSVICGDIVAGTLTLTANVDPKMDSGTFNVGKRINDYTRMAAASCLMLFRGSMTITQVMSWKYRCFSGGVIDPDCPIPTTSTTTAALTTTTTTIVKLTTTTTTAPITENTTANEMTSAATTANTGTTMVPEETTTTPTTTFSPTTIGADNLVTDPVEALQQLYPPQVNSEGSIPVLTAEKLMHYCSDFASSRIAPPNNDQPTSVLTAFAVNRLVDFSDIKETVSLDALLFLRWQVTTCPKGFLLQWLPKSAETSGLERLFVPSSDSIWLPKYLFQTSADNIFMKGRSYGDDLLATVASNLNDDSKPNQTLTFYFLRRGFFKAKCPLDLKKFPFDSVTCKFSFSMERSIDQVTFGQQLVLCPADMESTEWRFVGCDVLPNTWMRIDASNVSVATFTTTLARNPGYYVINLALPNFAFSLLELASYLIPFNRPERPLFAVATLLSLAVGQTTLSRGIPHSSERSTISTYITALTCMCAAITVYHLLACCLWGGDGHSSPKQPLRSCKHLNVLSFVAALLCFVAIHGFVGFIIWH